MNGLLGGRGIAPGLDGFIAAEQMGQQRSMNQLGMLGGVLGLQNTLRQQAMAEQTQPLQLRLLESQVRGAENPMPVRQDMGGYIALLDPRTGMEIGRQEKTATPDARLRQEGEDRRHSTPSGSSQLSNQTELYKFNTISPFQQQRLGIDLANLFNRGTQNIWETGTGVTAPMVPGASQTMAPFGGWQIPPAVQSQRDAQARNVAGGMTPNGAAPAIPTANVIPGSTAGLTPKAAAAVAEDAAKKTAEMQAKRDYNMGGLRDVIGEAKRILSQGSPTASMIGVGADFLGSVVGASPRGAAEADQLRALAGALTAKMPRMEGPQSDKDVQLYREMAGQIGDATLPVSRRIAALSTVEKLWSKYEKPNTGGATGSWDGTDRRASTSGFKVLGVE